MLQKRVIELSLVDSRVEVESRIRTNTFLGSNFRSGLDSNQLKATVTNSIGSKTKALIAFVQGFIES